MRVDNFISDLGLIKRRTVAKEMADGGHIKINDRRAKPGHRVKIGDIIEITGKYQVKIEVLQIPTSRSVPKESRPEYFKILRSESNRDLEF